MGNANVKDRQAAEALVPHEINRDLESFRLDGVRITGKILGKGSYAEVKELLVRGRKCAGKQLHMFLVASSSNTEKKAMLERFKSECSLLASVKHPSIVQFLGVYWERGSSLPILVMEFLPYTLAECIDKKGTATVSLEQGLRFAILRDVGKGLLYLHELKPPVIHRDLSANNVLLTELMTAKISDLGVAKIINFSPEEMARRTSTQAPGTPCYMPPEALVSKSRYTAKLDIYSYGVLMIHVLCGEWPFPSDAFQPDPNNPDVVVPVQEVDRRRKYIQNVEETNPELIPLIRRCLHNNQSMRPEAAEIVGRITALMGPAPSLDLPPAPLDLPPAPLDLPVLQASPTAGIDLLKAPLDLPRVPQDLPLDSPPALLQPDRMGKQPEPLSQGMPSSSTEAKVEVRQPREENVFNVDRIIQKLLEVRGARPRNVFLTEVEIRGLCLKSREIFLTQPMLLELETPIKVAGDIHGQYYDLLRLFEYGGFPPESNYLFLGNYVDHGRQSLETMCLLLAYKIKYPENFFMLRGNHECAHVNRMHGFYDECKRRYNIRLWKTFTDCFNCLPIAAIIDEKIFCCHGGLSPDFQSMEQICRILRPTDVPDQGLMCDLLWADPDKETMGWGENDRGVSFTFGPEIVSKFVTKHDLDLVVRSNQVVEDGYEFFANRQLVTLFSAPNYRGQYDNAAGIMSIDETLMCSFQILKPMMRPRASAK